MSRRNGPVIVFLLLVTLCSAPGISSGIPETEPNDNFYEAEVVGPGVINGTVNSSPVVDQDYFNITVPSGKDLFIQLEKMDSGTRSISVQGYDHQRKIMGVSLSVATQFQTDSTIWYNKDIVSRAVYLSVGGTGSYDLTLQLRNYTTDGDDSFDTATRMMEGNYSGTVGYIPYHYTDQDFYRFDAPPDSDVMLVMEKTDNNGEDLRFSWYSEKRHYEGSYTFRNPREYEEKTFYNSGGTKVLKYLMVSGEGDYNISMRIRTYPRDGDDTFETARTMIKGRTTGDVETYDEHDDDVDYYKTVVPPMNDIFVTLGKNGTEGSSIDLYFYTQHREPIQGPLRVDYAGQNRSTTWYYSGEDVTWYYLVLKGSGSYIIDLDLAAYEVDGNDDFSSAKMIGEGNFNDSVDKDPAHGDDVDFFITEIPPYNELRITLEALSVITYEIRLNTYTMSRQNYGLYLEVEKKGDLASKATYNPGPTAISIYLYLYGGGTYGLDLDLVEIPRDNNDERDTADQIVPGVIYGTVNEKYNDEKDWYEMKIGPDTQLLVKFQRTEGVQQLSLHVYVEGSNYRVIGLDLYSTQDLTQGTWTNLDGSEKKLAIVVSGDGDYSFNITVSPVFRDHNDELENATEIFEGNTTGSVNFGEQYYDQMDYLFLKIEPMTIGHIWIWMVGKESRDISVKFYDQMMVIIEGENRYLDEENAGTYIMFRNEENQTTRSNIGISGKGEYLIHLEKEPIVPEEPEERPDADGDGVPDLFDHFPNDKNEWNDTDNDGYGDNSDAFPYDKKEHFDTDLDGVGDNSDAFPNDKSASRDSDGDGHPDIWNPGMKDRSTTGLTLDQYPYDKDRWEIEEPEKADDSLSVGSIIMYLMIGLAAGGFLMFILLRRPRKEEYREE